MHDSLHDGIHCLTAKRRMPGAERVHYAAQAEEIGLGVTRFPPDLLWGHVLRCSSQSAAASKTSVVGRSGQAKVGHPHAFRSLIQKNVAGFDVSMNKSLTMCGGKCRRNLQGNPYDL